MIKQPAQVNYFFGDAYKGVGRTIIGAFAKAFGLIGTSAAYFGKAFVAFIVSFIDLVKAVFTFDFREIWDNTKYAVRALWALCYAGPIFGVLLIAAPTLTLALSALLIGIFATIMLLIYITYMILYALDLLYRKIKQISSTCRNCQNKIKSPIYLCPSCGVEHTKLIPSKYGIFKRRCECGAKIPTTFFNGREKLESLCPHCKNEIDSEHVDITVPVVGGPSAGKTCFIHMAISDIEKNSYNDHNLSYEYDPASDDEFEMNMNYLNSGNVTMKTSDMRLRFYSFYLKPKRGYKHQISLCDVGGEIYDDSSALGEQIAFTHTKAFLMVIDPLSVMDYRKELEAEMDITPYGPSEKSIDEVLSMLITTLENMCNITAKDMLNRDVAIVFSKGDIPGLDDKIGNKAVAKYMMANPDVSRLDAQNAVCEQFLKDYDEYGFLNGVKSKFKTVQYFASSALGHPADGSDFVSTGVSEPIYWIVDKISASINLSKIWGQKLPEVSEDVEAEVD